MRVLQYYRTSCVKQCYSICACILYSIVYNPQIKSIVYVYIIGYSTQPSKEIYYTCIVYVYSIHI